MIKNLFDYSIKCDELSTDTNIKANIIENGHYTSIVKVDAKWIFFNDSKYEEVKDPHQLISERAFVLVYVNKRSPSEVSNLYKMIDALTIRIREMQLAHVLSEKAKSNCKKYFAIFSSRANPFA